MKNKYLKFVITSYLITSCLCSGINAQTNDDQLKNIKATFPVIDSMLSNYAKQNHFPGLVYGLIVDGKLIHTGNLGYLNTSQKTVADSKSSFRIASMTKSLLQWQLLNLEMKTN
jgi:CubicO group peptidase (beta-lactamase class C family)